MDPKNGRLFYTEYSGVTAATIAQAMGATFTSDELTYTTRLITAIERTIAKKCNRNFLCVSGEEEVVYTESFDSNKYEYFCSNFPIKEITKIVLSSVTQYEKDGESNKLTLGSDFYNYENSIRFAVPPCGTQIYRSLEIQYTIEQFWNEDIVQAITTWVVDLLQSKEYGGQSVKKFSFASMQIEFSPKESDIPSYVTEVIESYHVPII